MKEWTSIVFVTRRVDNAPFFEVPSNIQTVVFSPLLNRDRIQNILRFLESPLQPERSGELSLHFSPFDAFEFIRQSAESLFASEGIAEIPGRINLIENVHRLSP